MYLGGVFVCINPLALRALPLYFAAQNTGGECEMYIPFASAPMLFKMPRSVTANCVSNRGIYTNNPH